MVAVRLASTPALTPLPRPSDSTEMIRPSSLIFREAKTSPATACPCLGFWQKSTSIKLSPVMVLLRFFLRLGRGERIDNGIECDFGFRRVFAQQPGNFLRGSQAALDDLLSLLD